MVHTRISLLALLCVLCFGAWGCSADEPGTSPLPTPIPEPSDLLSLVASDPAAYVGQQVIVEGVLESEGGMPNPAFYLSDGQGHRLATSAWVAIEAVQPPQGGVQPKTMSEFVGKQLRLTGEVARAGERYLLEVSSALEK